MGNHFSKTPEEEMPNGIVHSTHAALLSSIAMIGVGCYLGKEGLEAPIPMRVARFGAFGILFGSQIWNTLFSGTIMIHTIPRHTFGKAQTYLLPTYFNLATVTAAFCMATHLYFHPYSTWSKCELMCTRAISVTLATSLFHNFHLVPKTVGVMRRMFAMEREEGLQDVVGMKIDNKRLLENQEYLADKKTFGKIHMVSAVMNLTGIVGSVFQLIYLSAHGP